MTRIEWEPTGQFEEGLDQGVLYLEDAVVPWNGLVAVDADDDATVDADNYYDGARFRVMQNIGNFSATVTAFTYPDAFSAYDGRDDVVTNQSRKHFSMSYRSRIGDDYQLHLVYDVLANPTTQSRKTTTTTENPLNFTWALTTKAIDIPLSRPGSHLVVDTSLARYPLAVSELEAILYGTIDTVPRMPSPQEVMDIFEKYVIFKIVYNGDGTWTATGPADMVQVGSDGVFTVVSPSVTFLSKEVYVVTSY